MVRDVAFGQYFPANSVIHKCDPRAKLIMLVGFLVIIFCTFIMLRLRLLCFLPRFLLRQARCLQSSISKA